jgi:hypothetical protein
MKTIDITVIKYIMENIMNIKVITDMKSSMNITDICGQDTVDITARNMGSAADG